uniref:Nucleoporin n=1 Tax=Pararge aegeria TaxID=116150 RepID=S4P7E2_9NEOP
MDPKECLELLTQATVRLRSEYIMRQQRASEVMARKIATLNTLGFQHRDWLSELQKEVESVYLQSTALKKKRALVEKHQEDMKYRCSAVVRNLRAGCGSSGEERRLLAELLQHQRRAATLAEQVHTLKLHKQHKQDEMKKWQEEYKKKDTVLGKSHSDTIWAILQQQTTQISSLIEETKLLKDQLGVE